MPFCATATAAPCNSSSFGRNWPSADGCVADLTLSCLQSLALERSTIRESPIVPYRCKRLACTAVMQVADGHVAGELQGDHSRVPSFCSRSACESPAGRYTSPEKCEDNLRPAQFRRASRSVRGFATQPRSGLVAIHSASLKALPFLIHHPATSSTRQTCVNSLYAVVPTPVLFRRAPGRPRPPAKRG